jgi:hypothetical protein
VVGDSQPVARGFLNGTRIANLPNTVGANIRLYRSGSAPTLADFTDPDPEGTSCIADVVDVPERISLHPLFALVSALWLATSAPVHIVEVWTRGAGQLLTSAFPQPPHGLWGRADEAISDAALAFASSKLDTIDQLQLPQRYGRVSNALRLFESSLQVSDADLALIGFVAALESLFASGTQELTFRLSLTVSSFLADTPEQRRELYGRVKEIYAIRSKLAHGAKIADTEEAAAISLVDTWAPRAADLARLGIYKVIDRDLVAVIQSPTLHERFVTDLLFCSAEEAIGNAHR